MRRFVLAAAVLLLALCSPADAWGKQPAKKAPAPPPTAIDRLKTTAALWQAQALVVAKDANAVLKAQVKADSDAYYKFASKLKASVDADTAEKLAVGVVFAASYAHSRAVTRAVMFAALAVVAGVDKVSSALNIVGFIAWALASALLKMPRAAFALALLRAFLSRRKAAGGAAAGKAPARAKAAKDAGSPSQPHYMAPMYHVDAAPSPASAAAPRTTPAKQPTSTPSRPAVASTPVKTTPGPSPAFRP